MVPSTTMPGLCWADEEKGAIVEQCEPPKKKLTVTGGWLRARDLLGFPEDMEDAIPSVVAGPLGNQETSENTHETSALSYKRMSDNYTMHTAVLAWAPVGIGAVVVASGLLYCFLDWFHVI
ncbi:hypothetical protein MRB53_013193 [Persea americana]|uniref:Uncharacterized protein n=1 Tax=Persea americana TaxID=3435 RepID=A0ACC2K7C8_PERAE|nr:hypothetical protein MRB53_013193 [Persea americana]